MGLNAISEKEMQTQYPRTYGYLKHFEKVLLERRSRGISDMIRKGAPFYMMFAIGTYTFAPWKVVWREQASTMTASVVGTKYSKPIVPDHKLMLVDCLSKDEAHFICACLNSSIGQVATIAYAVEIQIGPHILENIRIPRFDPKDDLHRRLAKLSEKAHEVAREGDEKRLREIEEEIDRVAGKIWGLSEDELEEIRGNLEELSGELEQIEEEE
jgi:hypothetical protein